MAFTLRRDTSNVPVAGFQDTDFIDVVAWEACRVIDEVATTNGAGLFTCLNKPLLDIDHDTARAILGVPSGLDIDARKVSDSSQLYVTVVDARLGTMTLFTDAGKTNPFASTAAKVTYWYARGAVSGSVVRNGQKTITTPGTQEPLVASPTPCNRVWIRALHDNTENVYVGDSAVSSSTGYVLAADEAVELFIDDLGKVYIDVDVTTEGVKFLGS
jgi:hypothetical protein